MEGNQPSALPLMSLWFDGLKQHTVPGLLSCFIFPYSTDNYQYFIIILFYSSLLSVASLILQASQKGVAFSVLLTSVSTEPGVRAQNVAVTNQISVIE